MDKMELFLQAFVKILRILRKTAAHWQRKSRLGNFKEIIMVTRKCVTIAILLACGIALVFASSGCKKKEKGGAKEPIISEGPKEPIISEGPKEPIISEGPKEPIISEGPKEPVSKGPAKTFVVEPLVGIDKVRFGMTVEQMKEILGEPQSSRGILQEYRDFGFAIMALRNNTVTMIACGDRRRPDSPLVKKCSVRTSKGIGMGSSEEDVISAYGQPSSTQQLPGQGNAVMFRYDQLSSEFLLMDGKVTYMMFRAEGFGTEGFGVRKRGV